MYLKVRRRYVKGRCINDPAFEDANSAHERGLVFMHKVTYFEILENSDYGKVFYSHPKVRTRQLYSREMPVKYVEGNVNSAVCGLL